MPPYRRRSAPRTPRASAISAPGTPSSGRGSKGQLVGGQWMCDCKPRRQAVLLETQKGTNKGRWFYKCPQERRKQCKFFVWEDYARVVGGATGSPGQPPSTYRTSIGQRTTPPEERFGDPLQPARVPATAPRPRTTTTQQQPLPPPRPISQSAGAGRQRIYTAPLHAADPGDITMRDGDYSSEGEDAPPTPTPARTRRVSNRSATRAATQSASGSEPEEATNKITKYFGNVKKSSASSDVKQEKQSVSPPMEAVLDAARPALRQGPFVEDTSDGEFDEDFDSDIDRGMMALADDSEHQLQRTKSNASDAADAADAADATPMKQSPNHDDMGIDTETAVTENTEERGGRIVPVLSATASTSTTPTANRTTRTTRSAAREARSGSIRRRREQLAANTNGSASAAKHGPDSDSSFAALFNGGRSQPVLPVQQQPLPSFSISSSTLVPSQASTISMSQVPDLTRSFATAATSPPSSFHAGAGITENADSIHHMSGQEVAAWYNNDADADEQGASSDEQGPVRAVAQTEDPFNISPSKRVRFDGIANNSRSSQSQTLSQGSQGSQGKDHNVTRAVLQLLEGQPVETRVLQQVRALLNSSFEDYS